MYVSETDRLQQGDKWTCSSFSLDQARFAPVPLLRTCSEATEAGSRPSKANELEKKYQVWSRGIHLIELSRNDSVCGQKSGCENFIIKD